MLRSNNNYNEVLLHREEDSGLLQDAHKIDTKFLEQMHTSSIVDGTDMGRLEADPLASFTRSDFLRARLCLLPIGLRSASASMPPDDTYHKYHNWNDPGNLDKLLETIQGDIRSFELPAVEAASFAKGALRAAIGRVGYSVGVSNYERDNNLISIYTLTDLSNEEISKVSLSEGILRVFTRDASDWERN